MLKNMFGAVAGVANAGLSTVAGVANAGINTVAGVAGAGISTTINVAESTVGTVVNVAGTVAGTVTGGGGFIGIAAFEITLSLLTYGFNHRTRVYQGNDINHWRHHSRTKELRA